MLLYLKYFLVFYKFHETARSTYFFNWRKNKEKKRKGCWVIGSLAFVPRFERIIVCIRRNQQIFLRDNEKDIIIS